MKMYRMLLAGMLFLAAGDASADRREGPIGVQQLHPFFQIHEGFEAQSPQTLAPGQLRSSTSAAWASSYAAHSAYTIDAETRMLRQKFEFGVAPRVQLGVSLPLYWRGGGVLDRVINFWHDSFGLPEGGRDQVSSDLYEVAGESDDGSVFNLSEQGTAAGRISAEVKYALSEDQRTALSLRLSAPSLSSRYGSQGIDVAAALLHALHLGSATLYLGSAYLYTGDTSEDGVQFRRHHAEGFAQLEHPTFDKVSLYAGFYGSTAFVSDIPGFPGHALYLDTGVRIHTGEASSLFLLLREDLGPNGSVTDVLASTGFSMDF